jgi:hypothetical protein
MAVPTFQDYVSNAKKTEKTVLLNALVNEIREYFDNKEGPFIACFSYNPFPVTPFKKKFGAPTPESGCYTDTYNGPNDWNKIKFVDPQTRVYYSYSAYGEQDSNSALFWARAAGDINGNGVQEQRVEFWHRVSGQWTRYYVYDYDE